MATESPLEDRDAALFDLQRDRDATLFGQQRARAADLVATVAAETAARVEREAVAAAAREALMSAPNPEIEALDTIVRALRPLLDDHVVFASGGPRRVLKAAAALLEIDL